MLLEDQARRFAQILNEFTSIGTETGGGKNLRIFVGGGPARFKVNQGSIALAKKIARTLSRLVPMDVALTYEKYFPQGNYQVFHKYSLGEEVKYSEKSAKEIQTFYDI